MRDKLIVVAGAGGFIGGHLVADLIRTRLHQHPRHRPETPGPVVAALPARSRIASWTCRSARTV